MNYYKRIERRNKEIKKKLESAVSVYLVVQWAKWCVKEYKWTGRLICENGMSWIMPEVYHWTDHNGEYEEWYACPIHHTTSGAIYEWTFNKLAAEKLAETLNAAETHYVETKPLSKEEEMEDFFNHYA
jgi:hypothetical protein